MNAAVRAVVRVALYNHCDVYAVYEGYHGLVEGGSFIRKMAWGDVSGTLAQGGTIVGTARCKAFREYEGRLKAARNLLERGINNLIVIGGDGSLTGANAFKNEWPKYVADLQNQNVITSETAAKLSYLNIVGMVGSIDNDMCGTDMTIGADTALKRIIDSIDCLTSTAASHQRSFVLEVMGRNCGYLALMASLASGADYTLLPESPPEEDDWETSMCNELKHNRDWGRRLNLVIVAEGAKDKNGSPITSEMVKKAIERILGHDTRITVLGHVQRGGSPTVYDRVLGTGCGSRSVQYLLKAEGEVAPVYIGVSGTKFINVPLMEAVQTTLSVPVAIQNKDFQKAVKLRGAAFEEDYNLLRQLNSASSTHKLPGTRNYRFGIICVGAPSAGVNNAIRAAVLAAVDSNHTILGFHDGFDGLAKNSYEIMSWLGVSNWGDKGGCNLGTNRAQPTGRHAAIATTIRESQLDGLLVIGGFEAYIGALEMCRARDSVPEFCIPIVCLPATISNNVPGTDFSIGSDTALNSIVTCIDTIKQSATSSRARVFVVETHGGNCGYLATMSALAAGAEKAYTPEEGITLEALKADLDHFKRRFNEGANCGVIVRAENANSIYTTQFIDALFTEEGKNIFTCRSNVLGHLQQGFAPSAMDRVRGVKLAVTAVRFLVDNCNKYLSSEGKVVAKDPSTACMSGFRDVGVRLTPLLDLVSETDFALRISKVNWWSEASRLSKILAKYGYHGDSVAL